MRQLIARFLWGICLVPLISLYGESSGVTTKRNEVRTVKKEAKSGVQNFSQRTPKIIQGASGVTKSKNLPTAFAAASRVLLPFAPVKEKRVKVRRQCITNANVGDCIDRANFTMECSDSYAEESTDCDQNLEVCCIRRPLSVDDVPCGTTDAVDDYIYSWIPASKKQIDACWMAALVAERTSGQRQHVCDAVVVDSGHLMISSECVTRIHAMSVTTKRVTAIMRKPNNSLRQSSLDFLQQRCGQELSVEILNNLTPISADTVAKKGYGIFSVRGSIRKDHCTCRVCLPTEMDFHSLDSASTCYVSGFSSTVPKKKLTTLSFDLHQFRTNLLTRGMCTVLLSPQNLSSTRLDDIVGKFLCSVAPQISGNCDGGAGGSLTCLRDGDRRHILIALATQPVDCYSVPRLYRNIVGCFETLQEMDGSCRTPGIASGGRGGTCGTPMHDDYNIVALHSQTARGSRLRHQRTARRMQDVSGAFLPAAVQTGPSEFSATDTPKRARDVIQNSSVCWAVAVYDTAKGHCSGILVTSQHVLTAAHCVTDSEGLPTPVTKALQVFVGFNSIPRKKQRECEEIVGVKSITVHPMYDRPNGARFFDVNDIAVVELATSVNLENNSCACRICLDSEAQPLPGELCAFSGFGCPLPILASESCPTPRPWPLTWSNVTVLGSEICAGIPEYSSKAMACSIADGGFSGCYGDSGGGLACYDQKTHRHYLHAIFSFILSDTTNGPQYCMSQPLNPNYYTKVSSYLPWLIENVPGIMVS